MNQFLNSVPRRSSIYGKAAVATSQPLAAEAGISILREGGSAIDAAICMAAMLTVVEPCSNGLGGDLFAIVHDGTSIYGLNSSGPSGSNTKRSKFNKIDKMPREGWSPVTVPGCVAGWSELHAKFGKLDFIRLLEPAIDAARKGFPVGPQTAESWKKSIVRFIKEESWMRTFAPEGRAPFVGEKVYLLDHAETLEEIAQTMGESFYRGALSEKILESSHLGGGGITRSDLSEFYPEEITPLTLNFQGHEIHELPPNSQGVAALIALGILNFFSHNLSERIDGPEQIHVMIEAVKIGLSCAYANVSDPEYLEVPIERFLDPMWLSNQANHIDLNQAQDFGHISEEYSSTVYISASDLEGRMISLIQSNYEGFGSGIVIPGTGIAMQNRGACFSLNPRHPNVVGPRKRPFQTIIPGFVTKKGKPKMSFGVMGGPMQAQGHVQLLQRILGWKQDVQDAMDSPRFRVDTGLNVSMEPAFSKEIIDILIKKGHHINIATVPSVSFGGGQLIKVVDNGIVSAASDGRREGMAICI